MGKILLFKIRPDFEGIFLKRLNKFLCEVLINEEKVFAHVHDPGRLNELLFYGNKVLLKSENNPKRKTKFDLICAYKNNHWVLVHSGYHRKIAEKIIETGIIEELKNFKRIISEKKYKNCRIDFLLKNEKQSLWLEVKGCTLTIDGKALFPDAPTKRGTKHLNTLIEICENGDNAGILILIFRKDSKCFSPNYYTDPEFAEKFNILEKKGVKIFPVLLGFEDNSIYFYKRLPLCKK